MPILDIELVAADARHEWVGAQQIADAAAGVFGAEPGRVWVKLRRLAAADYAENGGAPAQGSLPVFVRILMHELPELSHRRVLAQQLASSIAEACGQEAERVHILFESAAAGRIAFGGELR